MSRYQGIFGGTSVLGLGEFIPGGPEVPQALVPQSIVTTPEWAAKVAALSGFRDRHPRAARMMHEMRAQRRGTSGLGDLLEDIPVWVKLSAVVGVAALIYMKLQPRSPYGAR